MVVRDLRFAKMAECLREKLGQDGFLALFTMLDADVNDDLVDAIGDVVHREFPKIFDGVCVTVHSAETRFRVSPRGSDVVTASSKRDLLWAAIASYGVAAQDDEPARAIGRPPSDELRLAVEAVGRAIDVMPAMRRRLPTKRRASTYELRIGGTRSAGGYSGGVKLFLRVGYYPDGRPGEIFLDTGKDGGDLKEFMVGFAVAVSLLLQVGMPVDAVINAFGHLSGGPHGEVDGHPTVTRARSMIDLMAQVLEAGDI